MSVSARGRSCRLRVMQVSFHADVERRDACGATPLVTDIPATRQIIGAVGSLTPVGDARSLGDAIVAWAACDRPTLRQAARAHFDEVLTFDGIGRQLRGAYETLAGMSAAERR